MSFEIYLRPTCPYCVRAMALLKQKNEPIQVIDINQEPERRAEMIQRSGRQTVPQIFYRGQHLGGCDDLYALEASGQLDALRS